MSEEFVPYNAPFSEGWTPVPPEIEKAFNEWHPEWHGMTPSNRAHMLQCFRAGWEAKR